MQPCAPSLRPEPDSHISLMQASVSALLAQVESLSGFSVTGQTERIQSLWSGYGEIRRVQLQGAPVPSLIAKWVHPPALTHASQAERHSHERKLRSYAVEWAWYEHYAAQLPSACRVPRFWGGAKQEGTWLFLLEDLDAAGFPARRSQLTEQEAAACLRFLAHFHAQHLHRAPEHLWPQGSYWHLATRPDELAELQSTELSSFAHFLDARLRQARHQTWIHGDAKLANFCFSSSSNAPLVAAVDFQYVGGGVGVQDVSYFFNSYLRQNQCDALIPALLEEYFEQLRDALSSKLSPEQLDELEREWRELFPLAWADYHRFYLGWSPGTAHRDSYSQRIFRELAEQFLTPA